MCGGAEPDVAHLVDVDFELRGGGAYRQCALLLRASEVGEGDACLIEFVFYGVEVAYLEDHAGVFGEEAHDYVLIVGWYVDVDAPGCVGERHLEESCDEATGGYVVTGEDEVFFDERLDGLEYSAEGGSVGHRWAFIADTAEDLCECATAESGFGAAHIDADERGVLVADHDGLDNLADVAHLAHGGDDDGAGAQDSTAVVVFLGHGEGVFARWDVYAELAYPVAHGLYCGVESCVFALLSAGPHPVGG